MQITTPCKNLRNFSGFSRDITSFLVQISSCSCLRDYRCPQIGGFAGPWYSAEVKSQVFFDELLWYLFREIYYIKEREIKQMDTYPFTIDATNIIMMK